MTPTPRFATRLLVGHGGLALICVALGVALLLYQSWQDRQRERLVDDALPRFSDMLVVSRLGDALAEMAGALAIVGEAGDRAAVKDRMERTRAELTVRLDALGETKLEAVTRDRLEAAVSDLTEALETLDALVLRRLSLADESAALNARLGLIGDFLPDLERAFLSGRRPDALDAIIDADDLPFPPGPSGSGAATAVRGWARNAQVTVGMMLAASGAGDTSELEYLVVRADESLRRAAASIRNADRAAIPVLEAVQAELAALAKGVDGADSVFRMRRQHLTMTQNLPAVLSRSRQASDHLTAAVTQIIADLEQALAVRALDQDRIVPVWRSGVLAMVVAGLGCLLWSGLVLWEDGVRRVRRMTRAVLAARDDTPLTLAEPETPADDLGLLAQAVGALDAERRRMARAHREGADRLAAVLADASGGLLVLSADGRIEDANAAAGDLLGRAVEDLFGRPAEEVLADSARGSLADALKQARARPGTAVFAGPLTLAGEGRGAARTARLAVSAPSADAPATTCLIVRIDPSDTAPVGSDAASEERLTDAS
ncbi:PAS domain-containing protein [Rhodospira trueperi]|uniref:PAS fold-containing protein n=1 Tax=Rhodospira trueperi TaxID=69960 RepID=A0A1G7G3R5_9PROT|nr:PAS domain-containing protein [Rhodospira trueperi]SDE82758.1 PAS fold-containing protein [Rhodospira trueperi]